MAELPEEAQAVLAFWFDPANREKWFAADPAFDATLRIRFGETFRLAAEGKLAHWAETPQGWLALLIVLDQFSRNLHRGYPRAWAHDLHAQRLALSGIEEGFDRQLPPIQRVFAYMPLEHAEDIGLQRRCTALFESLCDSLPAEERDHYTGFLDYARRHEAVIARASVAFRIAMRCSAERIRQQKRLISRNLTPGSESQSPPWIVAIYDKEHVMHRYLFLALLITTFNAHALQSVRVGSQVLVVGDSAARVKELLGEPAVHAKGASSNKSGARKTKAKTSSTSKGRKAGSKDKGEKWQYRRDGHTTTFTIVGGRIAHIEDVAR